jgi:hypothetical protein
MSSPTVPRGAYGITALGLERSSLLLPSPGAGWPPVEVRQDRIVGDPPPTSVTASRAEVRLIDGGQLVVERRARLATFRTPEPLDDDELAHPYLAAVGAFFAGWLGREAFHAGAFLAGGGAWALLGEKEDGKSTMLAWLALQGCPVLTDDVLVLDGRAALAGPRCIDLRAPAADRLELGDRAWPARSGERSRLGLSSVPLEAPLSGWVFLAWADRVELAPLRPAERLVRLGAHRSSQGSENDAALLDLAAVPAWELRRPRDWDLLPELGGRLLDLARG